MTHPNKSNPGGTRYRFDKLAVSDPEVMHGSWVFAGTRVPIGTLFEHLATGHSLAEIHDLFPAVEIEQMRAVLEHVAKETSEEAA